jgi:hypothetical protein
VRAQLQLKYYIVSYLIFNTVWCYKCITF